MGLLDLIGNTIKTGVDVVKLSVNVVKDVATNGDRSKETIDDIEEDLEDTFDSFTDIFD